MKMKFSIVTPVYNGGKYIKETLDSVISQAGDFDIEYIVMDGGSTDDTVEILKEYEKKINGGLFKIKCNSLKFIWKSEKDKGMYSAINNGFAIATGDIRAWINSDDTYLPEVFDVIKNVFNKYRDIQWVKGKTIFMNKVGEITGTAPCYIFNRNWIKLGIYGRYSYFINQDSVFWRSELWNKSGQIDPSLKYAGDYSLWTKFAEHTSLWSVDYVVSVFRTRDGQLSENMSAYRKEQAKIKKPGGLSQRIVMIFFFLRNKFAPENNSRILHLIYKTIFKKRMREYIFIDKNKNPQKMPASSYIPIKK